MKFMFSAYCFGNSGGQALVGVYKRCLRVASILAERGHEIIMYCPCHEKYEDDLTVRARTWARYVDIPFMDGAYGKKSEFNRKNTLSAISAQRPDVFVAGEVPMAGPLLETTLCAVELGIPVVFLDNAYNDYFVHDFCEAHGPMADGIVLTGASSFYAQDKVPDYLCQVPPYIEKAPEDVIRQHKKQLGFEARHTVTVLAYDDKVKALGLDFLTHDIARKTDVLFISPNPEHTREQAQKIPRQGPGRTAVISPPEDPILFGTIAASDLVFAKYGFMQVSECMALQTPVICVYHDKMKWLDFLPDSARLFVHSTESSHVDNSTKKAIARLLHTPKDKMSAVHRGGLDAASKTADFLTSLPRSPRKNTTEQCAQLGFTEKRAQLALENLHMGQPVTVHEIRSTRIRTYDQCHIHALVCTYRTNDTSHVARMWGRLYDSRHSARKDMHQADKARLPRRPLYFSSVDKIMMEQNFGEAAIPKL